MLSEQGLSSGFFDEKKNHSPSSSPKKWIAAGLIFFVVFGCVAALARKDDSPSLSLDSKAQTSSSSSSSVEEFSNSYTFSADLSNATHRIVDFTYTGSDKFYKNESSPVSNKIRFIAFFKTPSQFNIRVVSLNASDLEDRWQVPKVKPFPFLDPTGGVELSKGNCDIQVSKEPFAVKVVRKDTGEVVFDTTNTTFIYSSLYLEISTAIPNSNIFGWGERAYRINLGPNGTFTLWNKDLPGLVENATGNGNGYGFHPYYLMKGNNGSFDLVHLRTTNAMEVDLKGDINRLTMRVVGGILDFVILLGDHNPETAIRRYHNYLGGWQMPPFWALGWQQSKWGYHYLQDLEEILNNYTMYNLPIDVIWSDLDYMTDYIDFTVDEERFPHDKFTELLQKSGKKWVPIVDAGIAKDTANNGRTQGLLDNVFVKNATGQDFTGIVWPGNVTFVDFFHPNATKYWTSMLGEMYDMVPFAGVWIDMNEVANFCDGDCLGQEAYKGKGKYDNMPFIPSDPSLYNRTISLDSTHYGGPNNQTIDEYYTHPLFAFLEAAATQEFLKTKSNLTFVLTRSTWAGSGRYTNHWLGDVFVTFEFLRLSLSGIMSMNMNGIPFAGSDICGFMGGNTTEQLCVRWMQIGALYPFARNHHENATANQEPWVLGPTVLETSRMALQLRYSILKYYYSLFIGRGGAGTVFRPLFFEFPDDEQLYNTSVKIADEQILIGSGLMAAPVLYENVTTVDVYFPQANWFDFFTGEQVHDEVEAPKTLEVQNTANQTLPLYIRGGTIIQTQNISNVSSTADLDNNFELIVALTHSNGVYSAKGATLGLKNYSVDQTVYETCVVNNCMYDIIAQGNNGTLSVSLQANVLAAPNLDKITITKVTVYGLGNEYSDVQAVHHNGYELESFVQPEEFRSHEHNVKVVHFAGKELGHNDYIHIKF